MCYRYLLFDADDTLFDFAIIEKQALFRAFSYFEIDAEESWAPLFAEINLEYWCKFDLGKISKDDLQVMRFCDLSEQIGVNFDPSAFNARYKACLSECTELISGAYDVVGRLSKDYVLAVVTNGFEEIQRTRFEKSGLDKFFAGCFSSEKIGSAKPEKEFFDSVLEILEIKDRNQVLVIGDSLTSDIKGANNAGLDACWFNHRGRKRLDDYDIKYEISQLSELLKILNV